MLFSRINQLREEKLFNQAIFTLLEACCNGVYQNYAISTSPGLSKVDALFSSDTTHHVLAIAGNIFSITRIDALRVEDEKKLELPGTLSSLQALTDKDGLPSAFIGSEAGEVWQVTINARETITRSIERRGTAHNPIRSFTMKGDQLIYSPLGDPSLHLYNVIRGNKSVLKKNSYRHAAHIKPISLSRKDYHAIGYTDQEHGLPLLCLFDKRENLVWGVGEIDGTVSALNTFRNAEGEVMILAGTEKSSLYAVDARGEVQWKYKTDGAVNSMEVSYRPQSKEPYVFVGSEGGTLYLLDFRGVLKWKNVFTSAIRDCSLVTVSASLYPYLVVGFADNTIRSFSRTPAQGLAPLLSQLIADVLKHENCSEQSLIDRLAQSDYQSLRDFAEIRRMGFGNDLALPILQCTHLGRNLDEIIELIMPYKPSAKHLARLAEFRLTYEQTSSSYEIKLRNRFEHLYQRGDTRDAFVTGCQLAYQSCDIQWMTHLPCPADHVMALDTNRFIAASEKTLMLVDRLMPGRDARLSLPAKVVACFPGGEQGGSDHDPTFTILTRDARLHHFKLPLNETAAITLLPRGRIKGEIRNTSVSRHGDLLCFTTSDGTCYIFNLSSSKPAIISRFRTEYHVTVTAFLSQDSRIHLALGTRESRILVYAFTKGGAGGPQGVELIWSGDIEGIPESMAAAGNDQGKTLLVAGSSTGSTKAFDFAGNLSWEFRTITDTLQPGRAVKTIIPVRDHTCSLRHIFVLAGSYLYVLDGEGKLVRMFPLPESALCLDRAAKNDAEGQSLLILLASGRLIQVTYYLKNPLSPALHALYRSLIPSQGEEPWLAELIRSEQPALQAFALQQAIHKTAAYDLLKEVILSSLTHLKQHEGILRRAMVMSLEPLLRKKWDATLLLNTIDCDDLYQFSGMMSLIHKLGKSSKAGCENAVAFLKTIYPLTKREANHIAILQLLEEFLKDDPPKLAHFLFDITPFENAPWVSQEIGLILGRTLGESYAQNFNLLTRCFYVSSIQELKTLSQEIKNNLHRYERKFTANGFKALQLFAAIDWNAKERMEDPFRNELGQLKTVLNRQSYTIAAALFQKWERILKKVSTEALSLSDLSIKAWHKVERLNSEVRHSIVEGCFSGLASFSLMLKDAFGDRDIVRGIMNSIKQLPMVRETLTDYFDSTIDGDVRLKDVFFAEYKAIFKELEEIENLCAHFEAKLNRTLFRNRFSAAIPEKTRMIQREALARIDLAVKRQKSDVRALVENLLEHTPLKKALREASIAVHMNLSALDNAHFKVLAREHELFNALYEVISNILHHAFKEIKDGRDKTITISGECYSRENLYLKLAIADNGVGMTSHELARMRDISFQRGRTGDGVERVIQLVEQNMGTVHFRSRKGTGTTVTITLPLKIREEKKNP